MTSMHGRHRDRRGFTLIELLVVMGIIAVLGAITTLGYRTIARDAKLASGKNTVAAVLDNARGLAMKNNRIVLVTFRPRLEAYNKQRVEAVISQYTGESVRAQVGTGWQVVDRFAPIPGVPSRLLPEGIKVAGPGYGSNADTSWIVVSHLPRINQLSGNGEAHGEIVGVMYAPDGTTLSRNTATDSARLFVDFDNSGTQSWNGAVVNYSAPIGAAQFNGQYFEHRLDSDEPYIAIAPFLAVFNDEDARSLYDIDAWLNAPLQRNADYTDYISRNVDPIYFNRYTGVVMK